MPEIGGPDRSAHRSADRERWSALMPRRPVAATHDVGAPNGGNGAPSYSQAAGCVP